MNNKRFIAYFIDFVIMLALLYLLALILPSNQNVGILQNEINDSLNSFLTNKISFTTFINRYAISYHSLMLNVVHINVITLILLFIYYVITPLYNSGQTIGKKITKIKIVSSKGELTRTKLFTRALFINGLMYTLLSIILLYTSSGLSYFLLVSLLAALQIIFILVNILILVYKKNNKTIHDKISFTNVIEGNGEL